jgi:hypothetical protein
MIDDTDTGSGLFRLLSSRPTALGVASCTRVSVCTDVQRYKTFALDVAALLFQHICL